MSPYIMLKTISLLGVNVSRVNPVVAIQQICEWVGQKKRTYVCVAPVSTLVDAEHDPQYREVVNAAGMVTPDGMPVVWLAQSRGCKDVMHTYGPDLPLEVCYSTGRIWGYGISFMGGLRLRLKITAKTSTFLSANDHCGRICAAV